MFSLAMLFLQISDSQLIMLLRKYLVSPLTCLGYGMASSRRRRCPGSTSFKQKGDSLFRSCFSLSSMVLWDVLFFHSLLVNLSMSWIMILFPVFVFLMGFSFGMTLIKFRCDGTKAKTPESMTGRIFGYNQQCGYTRSCNWHDSWAESFRKCSVCLVHFKLEGAILAAVGVFVYIVEIIRKVGSPMPKVNQAHIEKRR